MRGWRVGLVSTEDASEPHRRLGGASACWWRLEAAHIVGKDNAMHREIRGERQCIAGKKEEWVVTVVLAGLVLAMTANPNGNHLVVCCCWQRRG